MADDWEDDIAPATSAGKLFANNDYGSAEADSASEWSNSVTDGYGDRDGGQRGRGGSRGRGSGLGRGGSFGSRRENFGDRDNENNGDGGYRRGRGGGRGRGRGSDHNGGTGDEWSGPKHDNNDGDTPTNEVRREFYIPPDPTDDENEIFNSGISSGINFSKYQEIPVNFTEGAPTAIESFEEAGLKNLILENVRKSGYKTPTPIQKHALPTIMAKRDLMGCAQTGSGKTAAFLLPIINDLLLNNYECSTGRPQALIISPTRELSIQIFTEARKFARGSILKIGIIYGGTAVRHQGDNVSKGCHILVCTPGRLLDFVERTFITFEEIRFVVLDEADRMLDMGFLPSVEKVMRHSTMVRSKEERQTLMFSATFPEEIQRLAGQFLHNYIFLTVGVVGGACSDVDQHFYMVGKFEKRKKLTDILEESDPTGTLVFVETKRNADFLAALLSETKFPTTSIHGDRLQREREEALRDFKVGKMKILIATSVAARGLDIKNISHVVNYDLPKTIDEYVHRIGRTGRVGNRGRATSFFDPEHDSALAADLGKMLQQAKQPVPEFIETGDFGVSKYERKFGGHDIRGNNGDSNSNGAPAVEVDEEW